MKQQNKQRGFVLVTVLMMVGLLMVLVVGLHRRARIALRTATAAQTHEQSFNCARAGLNAAIAAIYENHNITGTGPLAQLLNGHDMLRIGGGTCSIMLEAENGRLNVNMLQDDHGKLQRARINQLLLLIDLVNQQSPRRNRISYEVAPALIDWTDADDKPTVLTFVRGANRGAESTYYLGLAEPYHCANRPLETIGELGLVKGLGKHVFAGAAGDGQTDGHSDLRQYITVYGDGKVDINQAPVLVVQSLCDLIEPGLAQYIVDRRNHRPFERPEELLQMPGVTPKIYSAVSDFITTGSLQRYYRVRACGTVRHISRTITAVLKQNTTDNTIEIIWYQES